MIHNIDNGNDLLNLGAEHDSLLLIFTQPSWCVPCQRLEPHLQAASDKTYVPFVVIGDDADPEIYKDWNVMGVPTLIFWDVTNGKHHTVAARTAPKILAEIGA